MELKLIINECKQQRLTAQKCLFDLFATQMFLLCKRYLKNNEVAEEVLMNGFYKYINRCKNLIMKKMQVQ